MSLVIGRKPGESVFIGDDITVTVIKTDDNMLRLKIDAPKEMYILRSELVSDNPDA